MWLLPLLVLAGILLHFLTGAYPVEWGRLWEASEQGHQTRNVLFLLRLPRLATALLAGGALGAAGAVTQISLRNPLASPDLLGVTAGAGLGAFLVIRLGPTFQPWVPIGALTGAFLAAIALWLFTRYGSGKDRLILAGLGLSLLAGALTNLVLVFAREVEVRVFLFWTLGGLDVRGWIPLALAVPLAVFGLVLLFGQSRALDRLYLGDEPAKVAGVNVDGVRIRVLTGAVFLSASAVTLAGPLPFLGLLGPHLARLLVGHTSKRLVPASLFTGALFLTAADALAKSPLLPMELRTGVLLALVGAPVFLVFLAVRRNA